MVDTADVLYRFRERGPLAHRLGGAAAESEGSAVYLCGIFWLRGFLLRILHILHTLPLPITLVLFFLFFPSLLPFFCSDAPPTGSPSLAGTFCSTDYGTTFRDMVAAKPYGLTCHKSEGQPQYGMVCRGNMQLALLMLLQTANNANRLCYSDAGDICRGCVLARQGELSTSPPPSNPLKVGPERV
jgi:hypothetical protein